MIQNHTETQQQQKKGSTMPNRKKRKVYQFKQFDNLLTSSNIFNTLKKFREKKQVSIWKQFNSFDLSTTEQILNQICFNHINLDKVKNVNLENTDLTKESFNDETSLFFINLDKYINTILINSFIKNIYYQLRTDNVLNSNVKSQIWIHLRDYFGLETQTINHRLHLDFFALYNRVDNQSALIQNFGSYVVKKCRHNSVFKRVYQNTKKAFQNLLDYLDWDLIEKNKIFQCSITDLFYRFGNVSSFYRDVPMDNLISVMSKYNLAFNSFYLHNHNELFISNYYARNNYNANLGYDSKDLQERYIKAEYMSSKKTIVFNVDEKTKEQFPSVNLTTNNNRLREYTFKVVEKLPYAQMPYEKDKNKNLYLGVELEVNKSNRCPRNIVKRLEEDILSGTAICKSDGSLGQNGLELNIVPMTLDYAKQTDYWFKFEKNVKDYLYSYKDKKTGVHVHIPKHLLTKFQQGLLGVFLNYEPNFKYLCEIAGRDLANDTSYSRVVFGKKLKFYTKAITDRYEILNNCNEHTLEFRLFKGNISATTMYRYLEFVHGLTTYARSNSLSYSDLNYKKFILWVSKNRGDYPVLNQFHFRNTNNNKLFRKVESFNVRYKKRFNNISFNVPTLKLSEPLRFRRVRAIRTRANIPSSLNQQQPKNESEVNNG